MASYTTVTNLPPVPKVKMYLSDGQMHTEWYKWFQSLWNRVGGPSGDLIYDSSNSSQSNATLEGYLFGIRQELEEGLTGLIAQIIEQIQEQTFDVSPLLIETYPQPIVELEPIEYVSALQYAIGAANGAFSATLTAGTGLSGGTQTITNGAALTISADQQSPNYEEFVALAAQTVFNTTINTTAKAGTKSYLQVFVNGVFQQEGFAFAFTVTGANQITFNAGLVAADNVVIYSWS